MTHFFDEHVEREFIKLQECMGKGEEAVLLFHRLPGQTGPSDNYPSFVIRNEDIKGLGFEMMQDRIVPGHLAFLTILFARSNPEFTHYWTIEQDVRYTGDWRSFFTSANKSTSDLLTTHIRKYGEEPDWWWWNTLKPRKSIPREEYLRSYNPIYRLSRRAVDCLDDALQRGCQGHSEVIVPSILYHAELQVEDIGGTGSFVRSRNFGRHYSSITLKNGNLMYGGTFNNGPPRVRPGWHKNRLYHSVKAQSDSRTNFRLWLQNLILHIRALTKSIVWRCMLVISRNRASNK